MVRARSHRPPGVRLALVCLLVPLLSCGASWTAEEVRVESEGIELAGTLRLPARGQPPYPAAVILHGSGPTVRRDLSEFHRLTAEGMAVLTFDKRGAGESGGRLFRVDAESCGEVFDLLADDAVAMVDYLGTRSEIDASRIGLMGWSQAGWILPIAAEKRPDLAFLVALSGPAVSCGEEIYFSDLAKPGPRGRLSLAERDRALAGYDGPRGWDPRTILGELRTPTLWLLGGRDSSTPALLSRQILERARREGGAPITVRTFQHGDHALQHHRFGWNLSYWDEVVDWLDGRGLLRTRPQP